MLCNKFVEQQPGHCVKNMTVHKNNGNTICPPCLKILNNRDFVQAAKKPIPPSDRAKHMPLQFRPCSLAEFMAALLVFVR